MRAIKVTYRAVFEQPVGELNPMGIKVPGPQPVELFFSKGNFCVREISTPQRNVFTRLGTFVTLEHAKNSVKRAFETQRTDWQMWGTPPYEPAERLLLKDEIEIQTDGKVYFRQAEDYTHIIHAPTIPPGAHMPPAACGARVNAKCFISTRANVKPTCKGCLEVYLREYAGK